MLIVGQTFGPYRITGLLGEGGMGAVYRAHDNKLNRDVAIKVLLPAVAHDPDRLARFKREAQTLAALNHSHIAQIYGLEERLDPGGDAQATETGPFLIMEFVDGETLADTIARTPSRGLSLDDALVIAKQVADALQTAHEQGIVHRDLKPANIKIRPDGTVKVLDFGLAKLAEPLGPGVVRDAISQSPTITSPAMTQAGIILGTAAYMAPEQAKGRPVDKRADVWAFGCVLFEMLTGGRPFVGDDVSDTLARVLLKDPDWNSLPSTLPAALTRLLKRCLEKDPRRRLDSAAAAWLELDDAETEIKSGVIASVATNTVASQASSVSASPRSTWLPWLLTFISTAAAIAIVWLWPPWTKSPEPDRKMFEINNVSGGSTIQIAISPDGRDVVGRRFANDQELWIRPLNQLSSSTIPGTQGASNPFFSPDSNRIYFYADQKLKVTSRSGSVQNVTNATAGYGGDVNQQGTILFENGSSSPILRLNASGEVAAITRIDGGSSQISHRYPQFLPDGKHFLYLGASSNRENSAIYIGTLDSADTVRVLSTPAKAQFVEPDLLFFLRDGELVAQHLDLKTFHLIGAPVHVADNVGSNVNGTAGFSVSRNGVLIYAGGGNASRNQLTWVDRSGKPLGTIGPPGFYENPRLSHDGKRVAVHRPENGGDIWIFDTERDAQTRLTFDSTTIENVPLWSPDDERIAFISNRDDNVFNIYVKNANGTGAEELLLKTPNNKLLNDWSADGKYLLYQEYDAKTKIDLWLLPMTGDRKPILLLNSPFNEQYGSFSADGHSVIYESDENARRSVFVQHIPPDQSKWQVSTSSRGIGAQPRWRTDGKEVYYDAAGPLMAADVLSYSANEFRIGVPHELFRGLQALPPHNYDITDGNRFLVVLPARGASQGDTTGQPPIVVMVNWMSELGLK